MLLPLLGLVLLTALLAVIWHWNSRLQRELAATRLNAEGSQLAVAAPPLPPPAPVAASSQPDMVASISLLADRLHQVVLIHDANGIIYANQHFANLLGAAVNDLSGAKFADLVPPEYGDMVANTIARLLAGEPVADRYEVDLVGLQGQSARLELSCFSLRQGERPALLLLGVEVLPTQTVAALGQPDGVVRSRARLALDSLSDAIITVDARGRIEYVNPAACQLLGISAEVMRGAELAAAASHIGEADRKLLTEPLQQALTSGTPLSLGRRVLVIQQPDSGGERYAEVSAAPLRAPTGDIAGAVLSLHDVTEVRGLTRQISYQASHDALTGLVNRREFEHRLQQSIEAGRRNSATAVLCYIDLDRFKLINDMAGHLAGDGLLRDVAKLLREAVRDSDTVGRLGGDEFGLLLPGCPLDKAQQIADELCRKIAEYRYIWKDKVFEVGASMGLVGIGQDSGSLEQVLAAADSACYAAKRQGGRIVIYSDRDAEQARESGEIHWLNRLQSALKNRRFELYSQLIVPAVQGNDQGPAMEVLMRLKGEDGSSILPGKFLGAAEQYRLMSLIDRRVITSALSALGNGSIVLAPQRSLSLNVSGQTLADGQFLEFVVECFDSTGADPAQVCFEIAERAVLQNLDFTRRFIGVLHGMGCRFALDDFGSGVGSFNNLQNLAVDYLKIDGSVMRNVGRDAVSREMVTALMRMARALNFKVIAEQLEDSSAIEAARRLGVDYLQGYAVGQPQPLTLDA
jgi:diguanylate cyclase (GGDEF)-like protein/PAS domain S-box-containing protein